MRILTPADYGLLAMAGVFVTIIGMISDLGIGPAIVLNKNIDEKMLQKVLALSIILNSATFALLLIAAPIISDYYNEPRLTAIVRVVAIQFLPLTYYVIPQHLLFRSMNFKYVSLIELGASIAASILSLILAFIGFGVWSLVYGNLANTFLKTFAINIVSPFRKGPNFSLEGTRSILVYGGNITISRLLWNFYNQVDVFIAGKLLSPQLVGYYSVSINFATMPLQKISGIINNIAFPAFASIQNDFESLRKNFLKAVRILSMLGFPLLWGISSVAPELVNVLLGSKWIPAIQPLRIIALVMPLLMINNIFNPLLHGIGKPEITIKNLVWACLIMPLAFVIGIKWGLIGLSFAWVIGYPIIFIGNIIRLLPVINLRIDNFIKEMIDPIISGVVMIGTVYISRKYLTANMNYTLSLITLTVIGASTYISCLLSVSKNSYNEMLSIIRK
jgi:O-antigen/teichoic acid export membrane protein